MSDEMLDLANASLEHTIPIAQKMGLRFTHIEAGHVTAEVPFEGNGNHFGAMYAGVLFTVGEIIGGPMAMATFDMGQYFPLVKSLNIEFLKPASTMVTSSTRLDLDEAAKLQAVADETGKAEFQLVSEIHDEAGVLVARTTGTYQIRKIG
jgi:thioesterase domain-containing protein